jgi:hypothetical protein
MPSFPDSTTDFPADTGSRRVARALAPLVFVGLILTPLAVRHLASAPDLALAADDREANLARYGFALEEVAERSGMLFRHEAPRLDSDLEPIMPAVASLGAAVSIIDFDRDGWQDVYVTTSAAGRRNALYRNRGDGTFEDVADGLGIGNVNRTGVGASMGAVWGDYDNDGFEDLFLYRWGRPDLFRNEGGRRFMRVTDASGLPDWINANTAVWLDFDRDGRLDLFVGGFYPDTLDLWNLQSTRIMPESFEFAQNGGRNFLFRNRGGGKFEEVGAAMGLTSTRWTLAAAAADVDRDGDPDLFVANDFGINELYINEDGTRFREVGREVNIGRAPKSGMNASFGDVLNRGEWNLFVTNIAEPGVLMHGNDLWVPQDAAGGSYRNLAGAMGVELAGWSFGAQFGDLNNDGWIDLFVANGYVSGERRESYWYDYSLVAGGNRSIIADARNWPAMTGRSLSGYQEDHLWLNDGVGRFRDVTRALGAGNPHDGRAVAFADLWNRGALDMIVASQGGPLHVYRNSVTPEHHWVAFELEGSASNRSAIGAEVRLRWNGMEQLRQVEGGSGFASQNQRRVHFGLGTSPGIEEVVIRWPSGELQTLASPAADVVHRVKEPR